MVITGQSDWSTQSFNVVIAIVCIRTFRIEELESAVSASLHVNKLLNEEVEKYIKALEFADVGRSTWERRARWLCTRLNGERKQKAAASSDFQEEADSVAALLEQEGQRAEEAEGQSVPSTSGVFQPTAAQEKLIQSLKSKGTACGWLINPVEVGACEHA